MHHDPDAAAARRLDEMLIQADGLRTRINRLKPQPGSLAAADFESSNVSRRLAWQHGTVALAVSCDNMRGLSLMAKGAPRPVFAHLSLLRAAVDGASLARWLFDPEPDDVERARRGLCVELDDLIELRKAARFGAGGTAFPPPRKSAGPLLAPLNEGGQSVQVAPRKEMVPSKLAARYASFPDGGVNSGGWLYAVLSAAAHGRRWALEMTRAREKSPLGPLTSVRASVDLPRTLVLSAIVLDHLEVACQSAERYAGVGEPA